MRPGFLSILSWLLIFSGPASGQFMKLSRMVKRGEFENALQFAEKKMASLNEHKLKKHSLQAYHLTLGKIHYTLGDYTQSEKEFKASLEFVNAKLDARKKLKLTDFDVMDELALFYVSTGNFQLARAFIDKSLKLRIRKLNHNNPTNFRPYLPLGMLFFYQEQFDSARYYLSIYQKQIRNSNYTGFLDINRYADTYQVLSEIEMKTGHWPKAKKFAKKSARLQRHPWTKKQSGKNYLARVRTLNTLSSAFRLNAKHKKALRYNKKALSLYRRKYDDENYVLVPVYLNKAWLETERSNVDTARLYLRKTIIIQQEFIDNSFSHLSEYEKENYNTRLRESFHEINSIMLKLYGQNKISEDDPFWNDILNFIINTKALILSESNRMVEDIRRSKDPEVRALFNQWRNLKNERAYLSGNFRRKNKTELAVMLNKIVELEKIMMLKALPLNSELPARTNWKQIQSTLGENEAAIELSRINVQPINSDSAVTYLTFIIRSGEDNPRIALFQNGKQLEQRYIRNYFNSINHDFEDTISFNMFWRPIAEKLAGINTVYFSPDGVFHLLNADALLDFTTGRYVLQDISVVNMTNIRRVIARTNSNFTFSSASLFGSPDFSKYSISEKKDIGFPIDISPLPGTGDEVREINKLLYLNKISTEIFTDERASEQQLFDLQRSDVLHVATHGFYNSSAYGHDAMLGSGLVLAKDREFRKDGILTAYEASTLNLDSTKLVVLSACKSGLGEVREGEGVYGLQRAFEVAGVDHIIMTLWNVDDDITKEFMVDFYGNLVHDKNVQQAFKKSQLHLKEKYPEVFYWGAFKLISSF